MGLADLHIHTGYTWDGKNALKAVLSYAAEMTSLDVLAITDHNTIESALQALELASFYGLDVIPGCEISTSEGHVLALFIQKPLPLNLSLVDTLVRIGEAGGIAIAPHPLARCANSLSAESIRKALQHPDASRVLLGIEAYNASLFYYESNKPAERLVQELSLTAVGNSDAHSLFAIGMGSTEFDGCTAEDLKRALESGATKVIRSRPTRRMHIIPQLSLV